MKISRRSKKREAETRLQAEEVDVSEGAEGDGAEEEGGKKEENEVSSSEGGEAPLPRRDEEVETIAAQASAGGRFPRIVAGVWLFLLVPAGILFLEDRTLRMAGQLSALEARIAELAEASKTTEADGAVDAGAATEAPAPDGRPEPVEPVEEEEAPDADAAVEPAAGGVETPRDEDDAEVKRHAMQLVDLRSRLEAVEERARLARFADQSISDGSRYAFNQLEEAFQDLEDFDLRIAANAEIVRVESFYAATNGMRHQSIPVKMVDPSLDSDTELTLEQLGPIVLSGAAPPSVRARAAQLIGGHRAMASCEILVACIREEPDLTVLLEATNSFKRLTGYPDTRVFGDRALERWFESHRSQVEENLLTANAE